MINNRKQNILCIFKHHVCVDIPGKMLTGDAVFAFSLHLQGLHINTSVAYESSTSNASVRLAEVLFKRSKKKEKKSKDDEYHQ